jgi:hypothetical protein
VQLKGKRFGRLVVIGKLKRRDKNDCILWKCLCNCGKVKSIRTWCLTSNTTRSCGCLARERVKSPENQAHLRRIQEIANSLPRSKKQIAAAKRNIWTAINTPRSEKQRQISLLTIGKARKVMLRNLRLYGKTERQIAVSRRTVKKAQLAAKRIKKKHNGFCDICRKSCFLQRDHDHKCCSRIEKSCGLCLRGHLCIRCNLTLGQVHDSIKLLRRMIHYLKYYKDCS